MILLSILIILTLISLFIVYKGNSDDDDGCIAFGIVCIVIVIIFGWIITGGLVSQKTESVQIVANVMVDPATVYLSYNGGLIGTYIDVPTYNYLCEKKTVNVTRKTDINMYGGECGIRFEIIK